MVIACVNSVHGHYMKAIGPSPVYIAHLKGSFDHISDRELVTKAWELVHEVQKKRDLEELSWVAETSPRLSNLVDDIWAQVHEGRGHILYVERDKQQAGMIENSHATVLVNSWTTSPRSILWMPSSRNRSTMAERSGSFPMERWNGSGGSR